MQRAPAPTVSEASELVLLDMVGERIGIVHRELGENVQDIERKIREWAAQVLNEEGHGSVVDESMLQAEQVMNDLLVVESVGVGVNVGNFFRHRDP